MKQLRLPASAAVQDPVTQPLGPATISGTTITVDRLVNNPTIIPAIIRSLVAANIGYFADKVFDSPGIPVQGGAVVYEPTLPNELFLPAEQSIAPRAPGAEAPRVGATRGEPKIAFPESWSGSLEITDEAKERNQAFAIQRQMTQIANTFVNVFHKRAIEVLDAFASSASREKANKTNWAEAHSTGVINSDPAKLPATDFAYVMQLFAEDEAGMLPKYLLLNPVDAFNLQVNYGQTPGSLAALLDFWGLELIVSPRVTSGTAYFIAEKGIGPILYEQPLTQETERIATRKTTVTVMEARPVFIGLDATAFLKLTGLGS
jgi:hypothetical protein